MPDTDGYTRRKLRTYRADDDVVSPADEALRAVTALVTVTVTIEPGMTRSAAIVALLRALGSITC